MKNLVESLFALAQGKLKKQNPGTPHPGPLPQVEREKSSPFSLEGRRLG
jgi:hypothetical protein